MAKQDARHGQEQRNQLSTSHRMQLQGALPQTEPRFLTIWVRSVHGDWTLHVATRVLAVHSKLQKVSKSVVLEHTREVPGRLRSLTRNTSKGEQACARTRTNAHTRTQTHTEKWRKVIYPTACALTFQSSMTMMKFPKCPGYPYKIELHSHFTCCGVLGLAPLPRSTKMRSTLAGTQIGVPICFTEYPQPSSLAAELWTPCCPLLFDVCRGFS